MGRGPRFLSLFLSLSLSVSVSLSLSIFSAGTLIQSACQNSRDSSTEASVQSDGSSTVSGTWRLGGMGSEIKESGASTILASRRAN